MEKELAEIEKQIVYKVLLNSDEMPDYMQDLIGKWFEIKNKINKAGK